MSRCWAVWFIFSSAVGALQPTVHVVKYSKRETDEVSCMGGIVSSRTILTACTCVGRFLFDEKSKFYIFDLYDARNSVIKTVMGETHEIEKAIVSGHCMPSKWDNDRLYNNLGGWKIEGSFDLAFNGVLLPPDHEGGLQMSTVQNDNADCYLIGFDSMEKMIRFTSVKVPQDQQSCIHYLCGLFGRTKQVDCEKLETSVLTGTNKCSTVKMRIQEVVATGSPIFCKMHNQYYILGITSELLIQDLLWSRIDIQPNTAFYESVYMGRNVAGMLQNSGIALLLAVKSTI